MTNKQIVKYLRVWFKLVTLAFKIDLSNRFTAAFAITGKVIRFIFFLGFLFLLVGRTKTLAGYNLYQVVFFFLTFNLIDILIQFFLRGVYHFRGLIVSGDFDLVLVKPINPLFRSLSERTDVYDLMTLVALIIYMIIFLSTGQITITLGGVVLYLLLIISSFVIGLAFHIGVMAVGILTTEVDNVIMIYRDLSAMGRVPIDVYQEPLRTFLTIIVPIAVLMTFPAKALMGLLSWQWVAFSFVISGVFLFGSLLFWKYALTQYSSASS
jgi:ABC-2 type transport system permease protein